jgi:putative endonuclease
MQTPTQQYGKKGENDAVQYLKKNGYRILERNYRTQLGEIDIIARDEKTIVFVEVKARRSTRFGHPKWAITPGKKRNMSMVALHYLKSTQQNKAKARFDVVTIHPENNRPRIELIKNAFELAYG